MTVWQGILLGIIQGITEFFPVSSSGHLVIAQSLIPGFRQPGVLFDVLLHGGTLIAVLFFLRRECIEIIAAFSTPLVAASGNRSTIETDRKKTMRRIALFVMIGTVITGLNGIFFYDRISELFVSLRIVAFMLLTTGLLLHIAGRAAGNHKREQDITVTDSIVIGLLQSLALMPGLSRSGATIAGGIFCGIEGSVAARFSFLLSIPAITGAILIESRHLDSIDPNQAAVYIAGITAAAVAGFATLRTLVFIIEKGRLHLFSWYCWIAGTAVLAISFFTA
ncbi:MAG: undecaprenyl-diphosphate phosphatase [Deltaproteobacteria bacterium]|nr:undecaprenyl-diphosphate phosphatase [Deltaproteobacteria bacterium]